MVDVQRMSDDEGGEEVVVGMKKKEVDASRLYGRIREARSLIDFRVLFSRSLKARFSFTSSNIPTNLISGSNAMESPQRIA